MGANPLQVVTLSPETPAQRAARLMAEVRNASHEQVKALEQALAAVSSLASEIAEGGEIYPPGARELCRKLVEDAAWSTQTLEHILRQTTPPPRR